MSRHSLSKCQRGATLIVSMVLLSIMALFAVTSLRTTIQEERMSAATRERDLAFQSAEAGLRIGEGEAEKWARGEIGGDRAPLKMNGACDEPAGARSDGLYTPDPDCAPLWNEDVGASGTSFWRKAEAGFAQSGLSLSPYYIVEYISDSAPCGGNASSNCKRFRVTASSDTHDGGAVVILQSIYATE